MSKVATKEHDCKLRKQLQHLQDDWDSYKQSIRRRRVRCTSSVLMAAALQLLSNSPKKLMCSLQRAQTPAGGYCASPKPHDQEVEKVVNDQKRDPASRSGELPRDRRLLEALEDVKDEVYGYAREEEACSVSSSVLIEGSETSTSSCNSCGCPLMMDKNVKVTYISSPMSDPSYSSSTPDNVDQLDSSSMQRGGGGRVKRAMSLVLLPVVIVTLAFVFMMAKGFTMEEAHECCVVPT